DLAAEQRYRAVGIDAQPRVQHAVAVQASRKSRSLSKRLVEGKINNQRGAGFQEFAPRGHDCISFAARCTARTMRLCEAQRQRWPFSAWRISSLVGRGFFASSACADITMPLPQ